MDSKNKLLHLLTLTAVLARFPRTEHRVRHHPVEVGVVLGTLRVLPDSGNFEILNYDQFSGISCYPAQNILILMHWPH